VHCCIRGTLVTVCNTFHHRRRFNAKPVSKQPLCAVLSAACLSVCPNNLTRADVAVAQFADTALGAFRVVARCAYMRCARYNIRTWERRRVGASWRNTCWVLNQWFPKRAPLVPREVLSGSIDTFCNGCCEVHCFLIKGILFVENNWGVSLIGGVFISYAC